MHGAWAFDLLLLAATALATALAVRQLGVESEDAD